MSEFKHIESESNDVSALVASLKNLLSVIHQFPISLDREGWAWECLHCGGASNGSMRSEEGHNPDCELLIAIRGAESALALFDKQLDE